MSEEVEQEETKLKRITIKTETGSKWFDDLNKLSTWIQRQRDLYSVYQRDAQQKQQYKIHNLFKVFDQSWSDLQLNINSSLMKYQHDPATYNKNAEEFTKTFSYYLENKDLFTEENPHLSFFQQQADKSITHYIGALAVAFDFNVTEIDREMYQALKEADVYFEGGKERALNEETGLQKLKERWDLEFEEQREKLLIDNQNALLDLIEHNVTAEKLISKWSERINSQSSELKAHKEQFKKRLDDELDSAKDDLENLTKTYDDNLALHASVRYWGIQQNSHNKKAKVFAWVLGITTISVLASIILFALLGLDKPFKEVAVSKLVTAAALTTFGIWIIKIVANIFMSHLHLATDAQERRTMIHTYLALTRKGQGPKEEDRQLILQTLFRPSTTDMVKNDQGPTQLVDMINRLSPKQ
ncbi:DUF6161 domain-containing protein [Pseudoalteromonas sp. YIC-827]|uniref:DUF6161 domain-containing protein n=1 Tax=Pseudoalteromonas qingdaonensis TaxID=3131913 RepID=A0ABU9MW72_9GAMM